MAFLDESEAESLTIEQSVFHIVGPGEQHFQLLEAFDASPYIDFFSGRVLSVNNGSHYEFLADSPVRAQLNRIARNADNFQQESENLATAFNQAHGGSAAVGAFLIFQLSCKSGRFYALLKFEDEKVLSYDFKKGKSGKLHPTFGEIERTFVQNRNALQKAALIRLGRQDDVICVVDRQNPTRPAAYFENFLHVRRKRTEEQLTAAIIAATRKIAEKYKDDLPEGAVKNLGRRLYDASQSGGAVDGENLTGWFTSIVGPLPDDSPVLKAFQSELRREGMEGESFALQKGAVPAPRNRRVETASGVKITFPDGLQASVVKVDDKNGEIIIRDRITRDDYELERAPRAHS